MVWSDFLKLWCEWKRTNNLNEVLWNPLIFVILYSNFQLNLHSIVRIHYTRSSVWRQQHHFVLSFVSLHCCSCSENNRARWITYFCHVFSFFNNFFAQWMNSLFYTIQLRKEEKLLYLQRVGCSGLCPVYSVEPENCNGCMVYFFLWNKGIVGTVESLWCDLYCEQLKESISCSATSIGDICSHLQNYLVLYVANYAALIWSAMIWR